MSAQEERQRIIRQNIPKLIHSLTKFEVSDPNFQLCEQRVWHTIRNHRNLSVNSHEIKRRIDGMLEKFIIGNYPEHADHFQKLCDELITHPLCVNHYEIDVQWAIIDFLLNLSYNPVGSIRRTNSQIQFAIAKKKSDSTENDVEYWAKLLREDCIPIDEEKCDLVDSDLSDWSDASSDDKDTTSKKNNDEKPGRTLDTRYKAYQNTLGLSPPKKDPHFKLFDSSMSKQWLYDNVQHSWWQEKESNANILSVHEGANFCHLWNQCEVKSGNSHPEKRPISTTSEYCLLREIIWMFQAPTDCKFFSAKEERVVINDCVSIPSVTQNGLKVFLETFLPYIEAVNELQTFIKTTFDYQRKGNSPYTYECYASGLQELLQPFFKNLIEIETRIKAQNPGEINTILQVRHELGNDFQYLARLQSIHSFSILDNKKFPAHICAAHLMAGLLHNFRMAVCPETGNLAISLFLSAVKTFCQIIDTWWTEGRLDDWQNEFLVEKRTRETEDTIPRLYEKCKEKSFFVPHHISNTIQEDLFLKMLMEHSTQAGCTLNLLYQINKINELKNTCNFEDTLYNSFISAFRTEISKFKVMEDIELNDLCKSEENRNIEDVSDAKNFSVLASQFSPFQDEFLLMAFECNINEENASEENENADKLDLNIINIYNELNTTSKLILPLEDIVVRSFATILKSRISFANNFVMNMYKEEFEILRHLQNMRKVMLLEASDVMHSFYTKLFVQIESGKIWANPFLLTVQLDDMLSGTIPGVLSQFRVDIAPTFICETTKIIEAVDQITITYDVKKELQNIITNENISDYNEVFRFLLKVKWSLWALENLHFQTKHKTKPPYAEMKMIDLLMRRLELLRFWIIYAMQSIHYYLMTSVLQSMGKKLDEKILNCTTLSEMKSVHESYIATVCNHCFLISANSDIKAGIEQLFNLIYVLRYEWASCVTKIEGDDDNDDAQDDSFVLSSQIDAIESTYIRCHGYLASILNSEVYSKQSSHLTGLSAAFNCSMPY